MKILGVNGRLYSHDLFEDAIKDAKDSSKPISIIYVNDEFIKTTTIDYHGGLRYPHLTRDDAKPDYLDDLIKAKTAGK